MPVAYHFTVKLRTDIKRRLALELFRWLGFLALLHWFRGRIHVLILVVGPALRGLGAVICNSRAKEPFSSGGLNQTS